MTHKEMTAEDLQNKKKKWRKEQIFACVMASIPKARMPYWPVATQPSL